MSENPVMYFPITKRISTELFISGKQGLYIQTERIKKLSYFKKKGKLKLAEIGSNAN